MQTATAASFETPAITFNRDELATAVRNLDRRVRPTELGFTRARYHFMTGLQDYEKLARWLLQMAPAYDLTETAGAGLPDAHPHYQAMLDYAKDAMETSQPWERWEHRPFIGAGWYQQARHPTWNPAVQYRRKSKS